MKNKNLVKSKKKQSLERNKTKRITAGRSRKCAHLCSSCGH